MEEKGKEKASPEEVVTWLESPEGEAWRIERCMVISKFIASIKSDMELHRNGTTGCIICNGKLQPLLEENRSWLLAHFRTYWNPDAYPECA